MSIEIRAKVAADLKGGKLTFEIQPHYGEESREKCVITAEGYDKEVVLRCSLDQLVEIHTSMGRMIAMGRE